MPSFPRCFHRGGELPGGKVECGHPQLMTPDGVTLAGCLECAAAGIFCDKPPVTQPTRVMRNKRPHLLSRVWNVTQAMRAFASDGFTTVSETQYQKRLELCDGCPHRWNDDCLLCGCRLSLKARGRAFACPVGKWLAVAEPAEGDGSQSDQQDA